MASSFSRVLSMKKVCFKDSTNVLEDEMVVDTMTSRTLSWEDLVLRNKSDGQKVMDESNPLDKDFALQDEDVKKSIANDIPSIDFSKSIHQLLVEEMATSVNGYFLDKYQSVEAMRRYCHKFLGLFLGSFQVFRVYYTERKYYEKLGDLIGKVTKLYFNTDNKARGHYARMVVYINLDKPLISQVLFNEKIQKIKSSFSAASEVVLQLVATIPAVVESSIENGEYNQWMLVEWKSRCQSREPNKFERSEKGEEITGSRFQSLVAPDSKVVNRNFVKEDLSRSKKHGKRVLIDDGVKNDDLKAANVGMVAGIFSSILVEGNNDFSLRFNLTFEELNEEATVVKGGILDAKKHSTIVFQEKENPKLIETSDSSELYIVGGFFKLNGQEAEIMMNEEGEQLDISTASQQPDIISILEPRVNRVKVDTIIANQGLEKLHCVEAVGFSR
ncbi:hypothetical protein Goari_005536, partial [Gossypium aridum]|nr:hypothetical protein [Gossypium aridum]